MKIIMCFIPQLVFEHKFEVLNMPPMAIYLLYAVLKNENYDVVIVDPYEFLQFEEEDDVINASYEYIKAKISNDDIVCFSSNTFNWSITRIISNKLAESNPEQKIILGGLHASIFDEHALKESKATLVIRGEGEKKLIKVIKALVNNLPLSEINGITYRNDNTIIRTPDEAFLTLEELQESPMADFSMLPFNSMYHNIPIESSRGCLFSCAFCSIPHRHNWRGINVETLEKLVSNALNYKHLFSPKAEIVFVDDCFTANTERAKAITSKMKNWIGDMKYFIEVRAADVVKSDLFDNIDSDLVQGMQVGVECGYDEGLRKIRKGLTINKLYAALTKLCEKGFSNIVFLSFIIGFPWEGMEEIKKTLDTVEDIMTKFGVLCSLNWLVLLPSDLWNEREMYGITLNESIYDNPFWFRNKDIFLKSHPLITESIMEYVEERADRMREMKLPLKTNLFVKLDDLRYEDSI